jgi:glycosyltransferase involved in cell wall biosynthesis
VLTAARLVPRIPGVSFLWVGDGPLRAQVAALASRLGIANRLIITGMLPNDRIPVLLKIMNVFLFASRIESFPLAILEAQASGTPVVTSGYSGVEQIIEHNKTGYIFPPGDLDKAALYAERLLIDTNTRDRIVNAAYNHVILNHSQPRAMARDFEQVYARVLRRDDLIV